MLDNLDYDSAYLSRLHWTILDNIELELGQKPFIVRLRTTGLVLGTELEMWRSITSHGVTKSGHHVIVDLGCGFGSLGSWLALETQSFLHGIDSSHIAVSAASLAAPKSIATKFRACDASDTGITSSTVGAVVSLDAFHLFPDPARVLAELRRILVPNGSLALTTYVGTCDGPDWNTLLRDFGFQKTHVIDISEQWRSWMEARHKKRLLRADDLRTDLGEVAERYLAVSKSILNDGMLVRTKRLWIEARG